MGVSVSGQRRAIKHSEFGACWTLFLRIFLPFGERELNLSFEDFTESLGPRAREEVPAATAEFFKRFDFRFKELNLEEAKLVSSEVSQRIEQGFTAVGPERIGIWADAWSEIRDLFVSNNFDLSVLEPKFVGASKHLRWKGRYILPDRKGFELDFFKCLRNYLFHRYLVGFAKIVELGSGSGFNVIEFAKLFPDVDIVGLDWSQAAVDIINQYQKRSGLRIRGELFDFFAPEGSTLCTPDTAVMTFCAFEQIGTRFESILEFMLKSKVSRVVHVEPTLEYYDPNSSFDVLAIKYHEQRKYLTGYFSRLFELEREGVIRVLDTQRTGFGSLYNECYSFHVWEPL